MRRRVICGGVCSVILLGLSLFTIFGIDSVINSVILDGVILAPETYDMWGAVPGKTGTLTVRNFTFFNMTNPRDYFYKHQLPIFHQMSNYVIQERMNFTNLTYSEDKSTIKFNYWLHFTDMQQSRDMDESVFVMNLAPIGFWSQLDKVSISTFAMQGFGGLFVETNATIVGQAVGQGVAGFYLANFSNWQVICKTMELDNGMCLWLWNDQYYGLGDGNNYMPWVKWGFMDDVDSGIALVEHFGFNEEVGIKMRLMMKNWCTTISSILDDWYCQGDACQNYELAISQLGWGGLTSNPPIGEAMQSVCDSGNITCKGVPEMSAFYKRVFLNQTRDKQFYGLSFGRQTVAKLFSPRNGTFLNIGNLTELFDLGDAFDHDKTNETLLNELIAQTHTESKYHAIVAWQYAKYFVTEFILKTSTGGTRKAVGMAGLFGQTLYQAVDQFSFWYLKQFTSLLIAQKMPSCTKFLEDTTDQISDETIKQICQNVTMDNYENYFELVHPCDNWLLKKDFQKEYGVSGIGMAELCDDSQTSLLTMLKEVHERIYVEAGCWLNKEAKRCTPFQIGARQLFNSSLTLRPIETSRHYPSVLSGKKWNPDLPQFQYRNFLNQVFQNPWHDAEPFSNHSKIASVLSFNNFYSVPGMQDFFIEKNQTIIYDRYYWSNKSLLIDFMRFVIMEVGFGGLTQKRTPRELLFGYQDPFLTKMKELDPMLGGDPSITTLVMVNDPNITIEEAALKPQQMYTGYSDPKKTRNYISNYDLSYISFNKTWWTGYQIKSQMTNPYVKPVDLYGTDAAQNLPLSTCDDIQYIYVDTLYRVGQLDFDGYDQKFGFDLLRYRMADRFIGSEERYPQNANFYQGYQGLLNLSFLGLPMFASQNHWLGADQVWQDRVRVYDETGTYRQLPSIYDATKMLMEPKSGASFEASLFLQSSVEIKPDILFQIDTVLMPVISVFRSANLSESAANDLLQPLKIAIAAPRKLMLLFVCLLLITLGCVCCCVRNQGQKEVSPSLLESTDSVFPNQEGEEAEE